MQAVTPSVSLTTLILGSVAVSAIVSSVMTLFGQFFERKARRRELLLAESVKLAMAHSDKLLEIAKMGRTEVYIPEHLRLVHTYFAGMSQLILNGQMPNGILTTDSQEDRDAFAEKWARK